MLDVTDLLLFGIVFVAALLQTTSGFGFALLAMPLAALVIGVKPAAPLVALIADENQRFNSAQNLVQNYASNDPDGARKWLTELNLPEARKTQLFNQIKK